MGSRSTRPSLSSRERGGDVDLAADDRLDPGFLAGLVEVDRAVHDAVVGDGQGGHLELGRSLHERVDAARPIEQRELGVVVQVDEGFRGVRHPFGWVWRTPGIVYLATGIRPRPGRSGNDSPPHQGGRSQSHESQWPNFVVAEDGGTIVGIGQVKTHGDGSRELASIAVIPARQSQGIGGRLSRPSSPVSRASSISPAGASFRGTTSASASGVWTRPSFPSISGE